MADDHSLDIERALDALPSCDVTSMGDGELRELLTAMESLRNGAEALQAQVMVEMQRRAHRDDIADVTGAANEQEESTSIVVSTGTREEFVVDEIAVHLHCTRVAASHRFNTAITAATYPALSAAWSRGAIDARKVQVIGEGLYGTDAVFADTVAVSAIDYARTHTAPQVRAWLARRVIAADPKAAEVRRERATSGRRVSLTPLPDGVAELSALMPAVQARQIYDTLNAIAHATDGDDVRTLDQRRSDALYDLATGRAEPPQVHLNVTVPASVLVGVGDGPALLAGYGPITASEAQALVAAPLRDGCHGVGGGAVVSWQRLLTDPTTGALTDLSPRYRPPTRVDRAVRSRDVTCRFPGCRRSANTPRNGVDLDHTVPWPAGSTSADNLACLCRHHHRVKHSPGWAVVLNSDGAMEWTTPGGRRFTTHPWQYDDPLPLRE